MRLPLHWPRGAGSFVTIPGGFPILAEDEIVGAVGVSGAGIKDVEISQTAAALLNK
jgi:uncharacterized protein GlcG (DUF336 family)